MKKREIIIGSRILGIISTFLGQSNLFMFYTGLFSVGRITHPEYGIPFCLFTAKIPTENA